jgi:hypothetical protein
MEWGTPLTPTWPRRVELTMFEGYAPFRRVCAPVFGHRQRGPCLERVARQRPYGHEAKRSFERDREVGECLTFLSSLNLVSCVGVYAAPGGRTCA